MVVSWREPSNWPRGRHTTSVGTSQRPKTPTQAVLLGVWRTQ
jgi:hypothetical protein